MPGDQSQPADGQVLWWEPSRVVTTMWISLAILLGMLVLMILGMLYSLVGAGSPDDTLSFNWIIVVILAVFVLVTHQLIHALIARILGATPRIDLDVIQWLVPVMYCRPGDNLLNRSQFIIYSLAPLGILTSVGIILMPFDVRSAWMIVPLALNASLSTRDVWTAWIALRLPPGSFIRVERDGLRLFLPT